MDNSLASVIAFTMARCRSSGMRDHSPRKSAMSCADARDNLLMSPGATSSSDSASWRSVRTNGESLVGDVLDMDSLNHVTYTMSLQAQRSNLPGVRQCFLIQFA